LSVGVVTDSACSLPADLVAAHGVAVVPMSVSVGGKAYRDGELDMAEVVARLGEGLTTSGPSPGDLVGAAKEADEGDGVAVLTVSKAMSSTWESARLAAKLLQGEMEVAVVDTGTAAGGEGLVVLAASRAAQAGAPLEGVVRAAEKASNGVRLLATLPSLEALARSGRVPGVAAWGAGRLGLNPVFEMRGGRTRPVRPARSARLAQERILAAFARDFQAARRAPAVHLAALHAMDEPTAKGLLARAVDLAGARPLTAFVGSFSPVMVAHTGPGLVGLAWWLEER
jgi:DegV family protein with EDD domain